MIVTLAAALLAQQAVEAPDQDWRALDQENLLYITVEKAPASASFDSILADRDTELVVVELYPELAPSHVERMKILARERFYDGREFHRVIKDFMAQAGGVRNNPSGGLSGMPDLEGEFTARLGPQVEIREVQPERVVNERLGGMGKAPAGLYKGAHVGYQPAPQAFISADGKRDVWIIQCEGTASAARTSNPDSANFQFFMTTGDANWLNAQYTAWGRVVHGQDAVNEIRLGEPPDNPDKIKSMRVGADLPEAEQLQIESLNPSSGWFEAWLADNPESDVCDVPTPTRITESD